jgi:thiol-disulfide isomerase/thioredoxin
MNKVFILFGIMLLVMPAVCVAAPDAPAALAIGAKGPDFDLKGFTIAAGGEITEQQYQLKSFAEAKLILLVFTGNHCPTAQAYEGRIRQLAKEYRDRGVAVVAVSSNNPESLRLDELRYTDLSDTYPETQRRARELGFDFPYLWDGDEQTMATAYGAAATPHAFILDAERTLRYQGRIDDNENPAKVKSHDARNALDALLRGEDPPVTQTRTFGCSLKWLSKKDSVREDMAKLARETASLEPIDVAGIEALMKNDGKKLRLINVWATWCGGCVAEFPDLVELHRIYRMRDFELVTVSIDTMDQRDKALEFLNQQAASCRNTISSVEDRDALADALDPSWNGAMPYTLLVAPGGEILFRQTGMIDPPEVKRVIVDYLGRYYFTPEPGFPVR